MCKGGAPRRVQYPRTLAPRRFTSHRVPATVHASDGDKCSRWRCNGFPLEVGVFDPSPRSIRRRKRFAYGMLGARLHDLTGEVLYPDPWTTVSRFCSKTPSTSSLHVFSPAFFFFSILITYRNTVKLQRQRLQSRHSFSNFFYPFRFLF
jgi:hypothetical protein